MRNHGIAELFNEIADILEILDENPFKVRAYRRASQSLNGLSEDVALLAAENRLTDVPGIGKELAAKITEIINTGKLRYYGEIRKKVPSAILDMMAIPGIGPKTARLLYYRLGIKNVRQLEKEAKLHRLSGNVEGLKEKTEKNIIRGIELVKKRQARMPLKEALEIGEELLSQLKRRGPVNNISLAGSLRRMRETVRDIDILVSTDDPGEITNGFLSLPAVKDIVETGPTKSSVITKDGIQIDLRIVDDDSFGSALVYFTGSQAHNIHIRHIAKQAGLKVNEYGVFSDETGKRIAGRTEKDVYKALGMPWLPPEIREDRGEVEAALGGKVPKLVEISDIKGDFHVHSDWSDGAGSIEEMASTCARLGYKYVFITDHSKSLKVARGLSEADVDRKIDYIRRLNKKMRGIRILAGTEVDIMQDGSLDYGPKTLKKFDLVVAAVHSGFRQSKAKLTERIIRAMESGKVNIVAHPTGRLMGSRDAYDLDFKEIFRVAKKTNTCLEISAFYERLDLDDVNARSAKEFGVKLAIGTDSHMPEQLNSMRFGVSVARRAWLGREDILNSLSLADLLKFLKK